jgi:hypothetical protein
LLRLAVASVGRKPGKERLIAMLLDSADLAEGGWEVFRQRTFRAGALRGATHEARRARKIGGITAWRRLVRNQPSRTLACSVASFASPSDARSQVSKTLHFVIRRSTARYTMSGERIVEDQEIPGVLEPLVYEERFIGPRGPGGSILVAGAVDEIVFNLEFSALGELWSWDDVRSIAAKQVEKIQRVRRGPT